MNNVQIGDRVYYNWNEAEVIGLTHIVDGTPALQLVCVENKEKTCTAKTCDCVTMESWWHGDAVSESGIQY